MNRLRLAPPFPRGVGGDHHLIAFTTRLGLLYLYHYFPALLFSFCLFALLVEEARQFGNFALNTRRKILILSGLAAAIFVSYRFYSPLTYYQPLTDDQFRQRMIFPLWDLRCVKCERTGFLKS